MESPGRNAASHVVASRIIYAISAALLTAFGVHGSGNVSMNPVVLGRYSYLYFIILMVVFLFGALLIGAAISKRVCSNKKLLFSFLAALFLFLSSEVLARVLMRYVIPAETRRNFASYDDSFGLEYRFIPHHYHLYDLNPAYRTVVNRHNALGLRGDTIPLDKAGRFRIVCIGGSTTYGEPLDDYTTSWPYALQEEFHQRGLDFVEVVNGGVGGFTSSESLIRYLFKLQYLDPDLLIVYHSINDLNARRIRPEEYRPDYGGYRNPMRLDRHRNILLVLQDRFLLFRIVGFYIGQYDVSVSSMTIRDENVVKHPRSELLASNPPDYFKRNLESFVALARARKIEIVIPTFASNPSFAESHLKEFWLQGLEEQNVVIEEVVRNNALVPIPLATIVPPDKEHFVDLVHFSPLGNDLVARNIADRLLEAKLVKPTR
jgi:lysophospholipase L1-like esterase